jgi:hypothetical protein
MNIRTQPPADPAMRAAMAKAVKLLGMGPVSEAIGLSRQTVERFHFGIGNYRATTFLIENWLRKEGYLT